APRSSGRAAPAGARRPVERLDDGRARASLVPGAGRRAPRRVSSLAALVDRASVRGAADPRLALHHTDPPASPVVVGSAPAFARAVQLAGSKPRARLSSAGR